MAIYDGKTSYENGVNLRIGDEVIVSPTISFKVVDVEVYISALNGEGTVTFKLEYNVDGRTGVDSVHHDHIHAWLKP